MGGKGEQPPAGTTETAVRGISARGQRCAGEHRPLRVAGGPRRRGRRPQHRRRCPRRPSMWLSISGFVRSSSGGNGQHGGSARPTRPPPRAAPTMPTVQPARGRGAGRLFRSPRHPGGSSSGQPLAASRARTRSTSAGRGQSVGELGDQNPDVDMVELAAVCQFLCHRLDLVLGQALPHQSKQGDAVWARHTVGISRR